jgi:type I restriction enzyme S subunit
MTPKGWEQTSVGNALIRRSRPVEVENNTEYRQIGIRSHGKGIFDKEAVTGSELGGKRVFWIEPDCFVVNIVFAWEQAVSRTTKADVGKIASHRFPMFRPREKRCDVRFIEYFFKTPRGKYLLGIASPGGAGRNKTLGQKEFERVPLTLPPLPEQRKIADILSTWDQAIEKTEALLSNARTQKRALMQQLLTGKRRFPEFEGQPWKEVRLGDVADVIVSNVDKKSQPGEPPVRLCNYTDVFKRDTINPIQDFMPATAKPAQIEKFGLRVGDVIITKDSETAAEIAMPTYVAETADDLVCGYHLAIIRPHANIAGRFLKFFFDLPHTRHYFGTRANGAIRFGLTIDGIAGAVMNLPPKDEQHRIAAVIADAEDAITDITDEITKLRAEKKALMQQLLTGKRRVKVGDQNAI